MLAPLPSEAPAPAPELAAPAPAVRPAPAWQDHAAWIAIGLAALPRLWAAVWDQSLFYPDEIHQTLEQAHRFAFHYGLIPWEFRDAARSWVFPGALGLYLKLVSALGVHHALGLVISAKLLMAASGVAMLEVSRRFARRLAGPTAGLLAVLLTGAAPLLIYFGARTMTEMASAPLLLLAAYLACVSEVRRPALAGALAALTIYLRYQNGIFAAGLLVLLLAAREGRLARRYLAGAVIVGIAGGMLDWVTWRYPFQSFVVYLKFNLLEGKASNFGTAPFGFFAEHLASSMGAGLGVIALGLAASWRRARGLVILLGVYFLLHSVVPHKELRFMLPVLPLAIALAAAGLDDLCSAFSPGPAFAIGVGLATAAALGAMAVMPTQQQYGRADSEQRLWHSGEDYFRTALMAEPRADLCGIAMVAVPPWWTGGYTYLHRDVPIYFDLNHLANVNYVLGGRERLPPGWTRVGGAGPYALYHRDGACAPDARYKPWLN